MQAALTKLPGVGKVNTDVDSREAVVHFEGEAPQTAQLLDALKKAGFPGTVKEGSAQ